MNFFFGLLGCQNVDLFDFTEPELQTIDRMAIPFERQLDETNQWDGNDAAIAFGERLFFSASLVSSGMACVACHDPELGFADGLKQSIGVGTTLRHSPSLYGISSSTWFRWDGGCDSLWCQAIGPIEADNEMGSSRAELALNISANPSLRAQYESIFGEFPDLTGVQAPAKPNSSDSETQENWDTLTIEQQDILTEILVNVTKSIAAYEGTIQPGLAPIDDFLSDWSVDPAIALETLSTQEELGLRLFVGEGQCHFCHAGNQFSNDAFHNIGLPVTDWVDETDTGRYRGIQMVIDSPFNASGVWSDKTDGWQVDRLERLIQSTEQLGQFKTPSLRNLIQSAPYMHTGQYSTLEDVVIHYSTAGHTPIQGHTDETLRPLTWSITEIEAIVAFLKMLDDTTP